MTRPAISRLPWWAVSTRPGGRNFPRRRLSWLSTGQVRQGWSTDPCWRCWPPTGIGTTGATGVWPGTIKPLRCPVLSRSPPCRWSRILCAGSTPRPVAQRTAARTVSTSSSHPLPQRTRDRRSNSWWLSTACARSWGSGRSSREATCLPLCCSPERWWTRTRLTCSAPSPWPRNLRCCRPSPSHCSMARPWRACTPGARGSGRGRAPWSRRCTCSSRRWPCRPPDSRMRSSALSWRRAPPRLCGRWAAPWSPI
jgi:hypothetical protein